jgi:hypothetical protein
MKILKKTAKIPKKFVTFQGLERLYNSGGFLRF